MWSRRWCQLDGREGLWIPHWSDARGTKQRFQLTRRIGHSLSTGLLSAALGISRHCLCVRPSGEPPSTRLRLCKALWNPHNLIDMPLWSHPPPLHHISAIIWIPIFSHVTNINFWCHNIGHPNSHYSICFMNQYMYEHCVSVSCISKRLDLSSQHKIFSISILIKSIYSCWEREEN